MLKKSVKKMLFLGLLKPALKLANLEIMETPVFTMFGDVDICIV